MDAIGILNRTPGETAIIAGDMAVRSADVNVAFLDRFSGTLILYGARGRGGAGPHAGQRYEIRLMKMTGSRHADVIARFASVYEPGMTDQAWSVEMFRLTLQAGSPASSASREASKGGLHGGTILAGDNGGAVPYDFARRRRAHPSMPVGSWSGVALTEGMAVMVDIAGNFYGYLTDRTRTYGIGALAPKVVDAPRVARHPAGRGGGGARRALR